MTYQFEAATFHPWVGDMYDTPHFGLKLLLIGESHYRWSGRPKIVSETTRAALLDGRDGYRFWRMLEDLLPRAEKDEPPRGWDCVAFYNYVQHFVGDKPRDRPENWMWTSEPTVAGFKEVLHVCQPNRVLIVGKTNWAMLAGAEQFPCNPPIREARFALPENFCAGLEPNIDRNAYWYPTGPDSYALCAPIFHPAFPRGFYDPATKRVVANLLDKRWRHPPLETKK